MGQYLVPPTLEYQTKCAVIFYPEDDGLFFTAALLGQLTRLQDLWIWETDRQTALDIQQIWAEHQLMTDQAWRKLDCEIVPYAIGDETLNINVTSNCGGGCGCGCGQGLGQDVLDPTLPPGTYPLPPLPSTDEPGAAVQSWKCDAAHEFHKQWAVFANEMTQYASVTSVVTVSGIIGIAAALAILTAGVGFALTMVATAALGAAVAVYGYLKDWLDAHKDNLICEMFSATSPANAHDKIAEYVVDNADEPGGAVAGFFVTQLMNTLISDTDWNLLFTPDSFTISPSNVGEDCSACDGYINPDSPTEAVEIPQAAGYWLVPVDAMESTTPVNGGSIVNVSGNEWKVTGGAFGGAEFIPDLSPHGFDMQKDAGTRSWGMQIEVVSKTGQLGSPVFGSYFHTIVSNVQLGEYRGWSHTDLDAWGADRTLWACRNQGTNNPMNSGDAGYGGGFINELGSGTIDANIKIWIVMETAGQL